MSTNTNNEYLLGQMNAKLDTLLTRSNEDRATILKLDERVVKLESWRWTMIGAAVAGGGTAGWLSKIFTS